MGEKLKGRGTAVAPPVGQLRMSKLSIDSSDDSSLQKLIKQVIETTRCSVSQAEVALLDNENDVQRAVLYILDRNGQVDCWTEQKGRKAKKEEAEKDAVEAFRRSANEASTSRRGGRGASVARPRGSGANGMRGVSIPRGGGLAGRGGGAFSRGGGRGGAHANHPSAQSSPHTASASEQENASAYEEVDWKKGPLVFESSSASTATTAAASQPPPPLNPPTAAGPISFAAMAKKATAAGASLPPPAPAPPAPPVYVPPPPPADPEPAPEIVPDEPVVDEVVVDEVSEPEVAEPTPEEPTPDPTIEETEEDEEEENEEIAQTWTSELKANLGIGLEEEKRSLRQRVEFVDTAGSTSLSEYQFGFSAPEPQPVPAVNAVPSPVEPAIPRSLPPTQHIQPAPLPEEPVKTSPPSFSRGLSYENTSSVAYPPSENRSMLPPRSSTQQQQQPPQQQPVSQQPPQQQQHSSMFAPQIAPYASYTPYMNMYSPVAGGMRADDPYAMMQYPGFAGLGHIDLSTILPQGALSSQAAQASLPPRTEHSSEMAKYGGGGVGGRSESVAPPPGFASNPNQFMTQSSLSSLLVQPQPYPNHFANFMMSSAGNNRYEEERRAKESRSSHQSHNTPPPHMGGHYSHHQQSNAGGYGSLHKKAQYPSNNWNNN